MRRVHAGPHKQHNVLMPRLSIVHHLLLEELQVLLVVSVNLQQANGHLSVPPASAHLPPSAFADELSEFQLLEGDVPLLQVNTGLAGLTAYVVLPVASGAGQVV